MRKGILFVAILQLILSCADARKNTGGYSSRDTIDIYQKMIDYAILKNELGTVKKDTFYVILNRNFKRGYKLRFGSKKIVPIDEKEYLSRKKIFSFSFETLIIKSDSASCLFKSVDAGYMGFGQLKKSGGNWEVIKYEDVRF